MYPFTNCYCTNTYYPQLSMQQGEVASPPGNKSFDFRIGVGQTATVVNKYNSPLIFSVYTNVNGNYKVLADRTVEMGTTQYYTNNGSQEVEGIVYCTKYRNCLGTITVQ